MFKLGLLTMATLLVTPNLTSCSKSTDNDDQPVATLSEDGTTAGIVKGTAVQSDEEALIFMREEEKMARDVYTYLFDRWGLLVFENITKSEQRHMDKVLELLVHYGIDDPALPGYGEFVNQDLQDLYNSLISMGEESVEGAIIAGATIEETDIVDLLNYINETDDELIQCVFGNLMRASRNHLRAFARHIELREIEYTPQFLSEEDFNAIVEGPHEAGGTPCNF